MTSNRQREKSFYPDSSKFETVSIEDAYSELSAPAFRLWIRMMAEPKGSIENIGVKTLAKRTAISRRMAWYSIRELREAGYLRVLRQVGYGKPATIFAVKRPIVSMHSHFVRL